MLQQLGINGTVIVQFFIFIVTLVALMKLVYEPFTAIHEKRLQNTKGGIEIADDIQKRALELQSQYSSKAKDIHETISSIFKKSKADAGAEYEKIIGQAKSEATAELEQNRKELEKRTSQLESDLKEMKAGLVLAINNKLLGKS